MRITITTLLVLIFTYSSVDLYASGPGNGRPYWTHWELEVYSHYCSLKSRHYTSGAPFYPDLFISFHVAVKSVNQPLSPGRGQVYFGVQTYLPNVPKENKPLHRIVGIEFDGVRLARTDNGEHEAILRLFGVGGDEADKLLDAFRSYSFTDDIFMELTLDNGEVVTRQVFVKHHFDTRARMLLVCTDPNLIHDP